MRKSLVLRLLPLLLLCCSFQLPDQDLPKGDLNGDGSVDVGDVQALIQYLLSGKWPQPLPVDGDVETIEVNGVSFKMVYVEPGTFTMGAAGDDTVAYAHEKPAHEVTLTTGYYMGQTEVTRELWIAVMGYTPDGHDGDDQLPAMSLAWSECQTFIAKLNELTGRVFRLPTEAEWEFAARGGNKSNGYLYSGSNDVNDVAWYSVNAVDVGEEDPDFGPHPVASKAPNELGLYDMSGNAYEWCQDYYGYYEARPQTDPQGPTDGYRRIFRGGSWIYNAAHSRVTYRNSYPASSAFVCHGMRLAMW